MRDDRVKKIEGGLKREDEAPSESFEVVFRARGKTRESGIKVVWRLWISMEIE